MGGMRFIDLWFLDSDESWDLAFTGPARCLWSLFLLWDPPGRSRRERELEREIESLEVHLTWKTGHRIGCIHEVEGYKLNLSNYLHAHFASLGGCDLVTMFIVWTVEFQGAEG